MVLRKNIKTSTGSSKGELNSRAQIMRKIRADLQPISDQYFLSIPLENVRKPEVT